MFHHRKHSDEILLQVQMQFIDYFLIADDVLSLLISRPYFSNVACRKNNWLFSYQILVLHVLHNLFKRNLLIYKVHIFSLNLLGRIGLFDFEFCCAQVMHIIVD